MTTRADYITHIMHLRTLDEDYARWALAQYNAAMPWLELNAGIRAAMGVKG